MSEEINEPIQVVVKFERGQLLPLCFFWRGRNYPVKKVQFIYFRSEGESKIYSFSLASDGANYLLVFNSQSFCWRLKQIESI